jgi:hypothetical protein
MLSLQYKKMMGITPQFSRTVMKTGRRKSGAQLGWEALDRANQLFDALFGVHAINSVVQKPAVMVFERRARLRELNLAAASARIDLDQYLRREARKPQRGEFFSPFSQ